MPPRNSKSIASVSGKKYLEIQERTVLKGAKHTDFLPSGLLLHLLWAAEGIYWGSVGMGN